MKKIFLTLFVLMVSGVVWGQEKDVIITKDTIRLLKDIHVINNDNKDSYSYSQTDGKELNLETLRANVLKGGYQYMVVNINEQEAILSPLNFKVYNTKRIVRRNKIKGFLNNHIMDKSIYANLYNDKYFKIDLNDLKTFATKKQIEKVDRVSIGLLTLPFKFRLLDDKSFETNFNLNSTLNIRMAQFWNAGFYAQIGAGIGNTNLYHNNAPGVAPEQEINAATLALLSGLMLQYNKVQAGIYMGFDHINNQSNYHWRYNGKPWFGFGVGYELFKVDLGSNGSKNKQ